MTPADDGGVTFTLAAEYIGAATVLHLDISGFVDNFVGIFVTWENSAYQGTLETTGGRRVLHVPRVGVHHMIDPPK